MVQKSSPFPPIIQQNYQTIVDLYHKLQKNDRDMKLSVLLLRHSFAVVDMVFSITFTSSSSLELDVFSTCSFIKKSISLFIRFYIYHKEDLS